MTVLERRYRRLLRVYPAAHRAVYEEEMLGVLLAGSPPGRRLPRPADAFDLLRAGLAVRFGRRSKADYGTAWRDAAAVSALLVALLIGDFVVTTCTEAVSDLTDRAAALLSGVTVLVELGTLMFWLGRVPWAAMRLAWAPTMAVLVAVAFAAARTARPIRGVVGRFGLGMIVIAVTVPLFTSWAVRATVLQSDDVAVWLPLALFAGVVIGIDRPVRSRVALVFLGMLVAPIVLLESWDLTVMGGSTTWVPDTVDPGGVLLALAPLAVVAVAGLWLARRFAPRERGHVRVHE